MQRLLRSTPAPFYKEQFPNRSGSLAQTQLRDTYFEREREGEREIEIDYVALGAWPGLKRGREEEIRKRSDDLIGTTFQTERIVWAKACWHEKA